jgi:hypothetical protein
MFCEQREATQFGSAVLARSQREGGTQHAGVCLAAAPCDTALAARAKPAHPTKLRKHAALPKPHKNAFTGDTGEIDASAKACNENRWLFLDEQSKAKRGRLASAAASTVTLAASELSRVLTASARVSGVLEEAVPSGAETEEVESFRCSHVPHPAIPRPALVSESESIPRSRASSTLCDMVMLDMRDTLQPKLAPPVNASPHPGHAQHVTLATNPTSLGTPPQAHSSKNELLFSESLCIHVPDSVYALNKASFLSIVKTQVRAVQEWSDSHQEIALRARRRFQTRFSSRSRRDRQATQLATHQQQRDQWLEQIAKVRLAAEAQVLRLVPVTTDPSQIHAFLQQLFSSS